MQMQKHSNSVLEPDTEILKKLTLAIEERFEQEGLHYTSSKTWMRFKDRYWWNYYEVDGNWWGFEVDNSFTVKRIV